MLSFKLKKGGPFLDFYFFVFFCLFLGVFGCFFCFWCLFGVFWCRFWKLVTSVATNDTPNDNKEPEGLPPNSNTVFIVLATIIDRISVNPVNIIHCRITV